MKYGNFQIGQTAGTLVAPMQFLVVQGIWANEVARACMVGPTPTNHVLENTLY